MTRQEIECQFKVMQTEADHQAAETQVAALALEAKTAQANADTQVAAENRAKKAAKDAPKDLKARREAEVVAAGMLGTRRRRRQNRNQGIDAAKRIAQDKAKLTSEAKDALVTHQKRMQKQKADMEAQAVKNAEQKARQ